MRGIHRRQEQGHIGTGLDSVCVKQYGRACRKEVDMHNTVSSQRLVADRIGITGATMFSGCPQRMRRRITAMSAWMAEATRTIFEEDQRHLREPKATRARQGTILTKRYDHIQYGNCKVCHGMRRIRRRIWRWWKIWLQIPYIQAMEHRPN